ncbi:uncharacterized protein BDCG_05843 [Blastomyces dermatitidis ER-3]|uniref:ARB-07466-like C-terminal domain-containing protein n=1 Tax=Ajellomyces dermatitidis (strain ER-3 / ATCC MYA-2586) TaxID=559297 RepID=A0ABX2VX13_AJEDR|nr:hypothetical protein, variant [Blastomyces dermatitidis ER-3]XP_045281421.1 uncharacterized protein BDCG_05843 [Blastomyces dermatitidis ER-3]EEQ90723.1 hypothetical protein, variant [Blastomyces dermatitidis ER-3]OAT01694.1 hypothetical protein BDCG_05843 [Blastomyces dermatitidis ER-3]
MRYLIPLLALTASCTALSAKTRRWEQCSIEGKEGHCMPPTECKALNGVSVAGDGCKHSPNGWQFCTAELPLLKPSMADDNDADIDADDDNDNGSLAKRAPRSCNARGVRGICIKKSACKGVATPGAGTRNDPWTCPRDPNDVWCCTKKPPPPPRGRRCSARGVPGICMKKSACKGYATPGAGTSKDPWTCPNDPNDVMCCTTKKPPPPPAAPPVRIPESRCKRHVIDAGYKILGANPGKVRSVICYGKRSNKSEHPLGLALDLMTGAYSPNGRPLAEWIMRHAGSLKVTYVIWGQKIWEAGEKVRSWNSWEQMENRGGVTANHWDHVHVSFRR